MTTEEKIKEIRTLKPINFISPNDLCAYQQGLERGAREMAEWIESQLMEDALNCSIIMHPNDRFANYSISAYVPPLHPASTYISNGDKVKIIIIREEEK